jgi:serralysin
MGGVCVAAGDVDGDGKADVITGAGAGGGPHIKVFSGATGQAIGSFMAYDMAFTGGVSVAAGDVDGDGKADIITGPGSGSGPQVKVFGSASRTMLKSFLAFDPGVRGGVRVGAGDFTGDGRADILTAAGPGASPEVRVVDGATLAERGRSFAYDPTFLGGVYVAGG